MGRKKVPLKDKELIKRRLAKGQSLRQSIKGTVVKSPGTAGLLKKEKSDDIAQIRRDYLKLIESFDAKEIDRARLWADMTRATKLFGKNAVEHPDWGSRADALRYIDTLGGIKENEKGSTQQTQVNIFTRLNKEMGDYVEQND